MTLATDYNGQPYSINYSSGATDHYACNGLGQRVYYQDGGGRAHNDSFDGAEPGALLLSDNYVTYTPGISERRSTGSLFCANDALGSPSSTMKKGRFSRRLATNRFFVLQ